MLDAKRDHLAVKIAAELRDVFVVRVQDSRAAHGQRFDELEFRLGDLPH